MHGVRLLDRRPGLLVQGEKEMTDVGFIGLGIMGRPMALNLLKANYRLVVFDVIGSQADHLIVRGAARGHSCADVAGRSEVIITMLPDGPDVEKVVLGRRGVLEGAREGAIVIDMSSVNPSVSRQVAEACAAKGIQFLDAPVSGGEPKAEDGTLAIMVGGDEGVFERMRPLLSAIGSSVVRTGPVGAGNVTKLANQIMVACNIAAMGEALVLATKAGVDPEAVFCAVRGGLAGSTVLNAKAPLVIRRSFQPGFRIQLHHKDLRNALEAGSAMQVPLPLTSIVQDMLVSLMSEGKADLDHSAIVQYLEKKAGVQLGTLQATVQSSS